MVPLYYELLGGVFGCGSELAIGHGVLGDLLVADGSWSQYVELIHKGCKSRAMERI